VDLFAAQAMLPLLAERYGVTPAAMGSAVNASTAGMAAASLLVALVSRSIDRRRGIVLSLTLLSLPTIGLAFAPDLATFTGLRIVQGVFMASAFTLTLAYLGEHCGPRAAATAFAAYITGNVASNLIGRLLVASVADGFGLGPSFTTLAALNLLGAGLVLAGLTHASAPVPMPLAARSPLAILARHGRSADLRRAFAIGFCILFAFIGTFTYVNFVLAAPPFALARDRSASSTSSSCRPSSPRRSPGTRSAAWEGALPSCSALPPLASAYPPRDVRADGDARRPRPRRDGHVLRAGRRNGLVSHAARGDLGSAAASILPRTSPVASSGAWVLGQVFDEFGWAACVVGIGMALVTAGALAARIPEAPEASP
jgi:predicted MFS family arabinose efflux permease